jgi:hypothetical protein
VGRAGPQDFMYHVKSFPPLEPLRDVVARLESAGIVCALGGSGLLAGLGLAERVRDWDVTTDAPMPEVREALAGLPLVHHGNDHLHADEKLQLAGGAVEVIVGFAFYVKGGIVRIPTVVAARREGIPCGSPEAWAVAYALLERAEKSAALLAHLARAGAREELIASLRAQPLPPALDRALAALPTSRTT